MSATVKVRALGMRHLIEQRWMEVRHCSLLRPKELNKLCVVPPIPPLRWGWKAQLHIAPISAGSCPSSPGLEF